MRKSLMKMGMLALVAVGFLFVAGSAWAASIDYSFPNSQEKTPITIDLTNIQIGQAMVINSATIELKHSHSDIPAGKTETWDMYADPADENLLLFTLSASGSHIYTDSHTFNAPSLFITLLQNKYEANDPFDMKFKLIGTSSGPQTKLKIESGSTLTINCSPVPVPATAWLLGAGLLGLVGLRRRNS